MTNTAIRFRASGFEIETEVEENPLGYRWWTMTLATSWVGQSIYVVHIGHLTTGHCIVADELGALRVCTPHELFPVTNECGEHDAAEYAAKAIRAHAIQPAMI